MLQHVMVQNDGVPSVKIKFPCSVISVEFGIVIVAFLEYSRLSGLDDLEAEERSVDCGDCEWLSGNVKPVPYSPWHKLAHWVVHFFTESYQKLCQSVIHSSSSITAYAPHKMARPNSSEHWKDISPSANPMVSGVIFPKKQSKLNIG